jgi:hypothetical protein
MPADSQQKIALLHVTHIIFMNDPIFLLCCMFYVDLDRDEKIIN